MKLMFLICTSRPYISNIFTDFHIGLDLAIKWKRCFKKQSSFQPYCLRIARAHIQKMNFFFSEQILRASYALLTSETNLPSLVAISNWLLHLFKICGDVEKFSSARLPTQNLTKSIRFYFSGTKNFSFFCPTSCTNTYAQAHTFFGKLDV